MNPTVVAVIATALALLVLNYAKTWLAQERARREEKIKAEAALAASLTAFNASAEKIATAMATITDLPKFMDGFVKVCQAIVLEVGKHRQSSDKLAKLILQGADAKESLQRPTDDDKDKAFTVMAKIAEGMSMQEAEQFAEDEALKKTGYSPADL